MLTRVLTALIDLYRLLISPLFPPSCRFVPSCSAYAREAVCRHGAVYGLQLIVARIMRCHPWSAGGSDPVPERAARPLAHRG